jgi:hypothetical protein
MNVTYDNIWSNIASQELGRTVALGKPDLQTSCPFRSDENSLVRPRGWAPDDNQGGFDKYSGYASGGP